MEAGAYSLLFFDGQHLDVQSAQMKLEHEVVEVIADDQEPLVRDEERLVRVIVEDEVYHLLRFVLRELLWDPLGIAELVHLSKGESAEALRLVPVEALLLFDVFVKDGARRQSMRHNAPVKLPRDGLKVQRILRW